MNNPVSESVSPPGGVFSTPAPDTLPRDVYGWDWSATTHTVEEVDPDRVDTHAAAGSVAGDLIKSLGGDLYLPGKGLQGWQQSVQVYDDGGFRLGTVYFGGKRDDVHVVSTSSAADESRWAVTGQHGCSTARVDTRVDTLVPFAELRALCEEVAGPQTQVTFMESTVNGESTGRTLYVGAPSSMVRIRVYEKWLESPGQYVEGTNRVEVQLRPPSRSKTKVSTWSPTETFCASKLSRRLAGALGTDLARPGTLQKDKGTPDLERTLAAMGRQYGRAAGEWLTLSQGDVGTLLDYLGAFAPDRPLSAR